MKEFYLTAVAALCASGFVCAHAQNPQSDTTIVHLRDVEVMANRADHRTPVAFSNLTAAEIERVNDGRDIPFLLESMPSVVTTGDAGGGIGYSGLRVRGTDASRINITANGVPINDSESHNVYWVNMPDLASSVRDIQLQRGAGTSANGAGAFGASVNMITDAPSFEPEAELSASYGSYNSNKQTLKLRSGLLRDHWSMDMRLSHVGSDGYIDRAYSKLWSYMGQLAYTSGGTSVRLLAFGGKEQTYMAWDYASKEEMEKYGRRYNPCGRYTADDGSTAYYPDQFDHFVQHHIHLSGSQQLAAGWRMNLTFHYTKGDGYYNQYKTGRTLVEYGLEPFHDAGGELVEKSDLVRLKKNDNDFGGGLFTVNYSGKRVNATIGGAANWHRGNHFGQVAWVRNYVGAINPLQEYYRNTGRKFDANVYARADVDLGAGLSAYADMQLRHIRYSIRGISDNYDWNTSGMAALDILRRYNFFNPKAGLTYTRGAHRAYASWSVAHKEPVRDNFTDGDPAHYPTAERLFDYEAGYSFAHRMFSVGVNLYYMDYKDQLVATGQLSDTGNPLSVNVPSSYRAGVELQASLRPASFFDWQINATLSRNRIRDFVQYIYEDGWKNPITRELGDTPIAFSPSVVLHNAFNFRVAGFDATLSSRYVSEQYMDNARTPDARLDSYFVSDLRMGYTFRRIPSVKALSVGFTVYNIFNKKYCNNGYAGTEYYVDDAGEKVVYSYAGFAAQAPAHVMASATISF
ncbi:MAG: TonB-dependent receptor [Muribaculaceae bacterium]|jgi:iron complex outermembrane receptor protein|nr:TonB-dependent receptor [Muribaculaceae bacterium]MCI9117694.1 TonB-dependent receptor [Muribaculaceae bacterium]